MSFIHDDFLLSNDQAVKLYHEFAKDEPILDFHNHLPPDEIANNRRFENLAEAWLEADHYKWRAIAGKWNSRGVGNWKWRPKREISRMVSNHPSYPW